MPDGAARRAPAPAPVPVAGTSSSEGAARDDRAPHRDMTVGEAPSVAECAPRTDLGQRAFSGAVLSPGTPPPAGLLASRRSGEAGAVTRRFAVHRNNVVVGLVDALAARFPVTRRLLGEAFFRAMAREFALAHPPRSPVMLGYGDDLPGFVAAFPPARPVPFAACVARLEAAISRAAHAADAEPVGTEALAALPPERLGGARLTLHPSLETVASRFPVISIHEREVAGGGPAPDMSLAEAALVLRPHLDVAVARLPPGGHAFVAALARGEPLGAAADAGAAETGFDLAPCIAGLFGAGGVTAIS